MNVCMDPRDWSPQGKGLLKTCSSASSLTDSDAESDRPNKNQSSLFIHKLYEMATCDTHAHIFGFSEDGMSLKIRRPQDLGPVLLRYFKHSNASSFIRQLNNYGFKTISSVSNGNTVQTFAHPYFYRDGKDLLDTITRKTAKNVKKCKGDIIKELQHVETEYRKRFRDLESRNSQLERKNDALEAENKRLRMACQEMERVRQAAAVQIEPLPMIRNLSASSVKSALMPLFAEGVNGSEPILEASSAASDMARPFIEDGYDASISSHMKPKFVDSDILETLNGWIGNEYMV